MSCSNISLTRVAAHPSRFRSASIWMGAYLSKRATFALLPIAVTPHAIATLRRTADRCGAAPTRQLADFALLQPLRAALFGLLRRENPRETAYHATGAQPRAWRRAHPGAVTIDLTGNLGAMLSAAQNATRSPETGPSRGLRPVCKQALGPAGSCGPGARGRADGGLKRLSSLPNTRPRGAHRRDEHSRIRF